MTVYNVQEFEKTDGKFLKSIYINTSRAGYVIHIFLKQQNLDNNTSTLSLVYTKSVSHLSEVPGTYKILEELNGTVREQTHTVSRPSGEAIGSGDRQLRFLFRTQQIMPNNIDGTGRARLLVIIADSDLEMDNPRNLYNEYKRNGVTNSRFKEEYVDLPIANRLGTIAGTTLTIGQANALAVARKATRLTHTLRYEFGKSTGIIATGVGDSYSWAVPASLSSEIPTTFSGSGKIFVDTFDGSNKIGTKETAVTFQVPDSIRPTLTGISLTDLNTKAAQLLGDNNFAQGASNVKITFNGAAGVYGSTIRSYQAEIVSRSQAVTANGASFGTMNWHGTAVVRATVTDSRGRTSVAREVTITVLPYQAPFIEFTTARVGSAGTQLMVYRLAGISPLTLNGQQKNTMTVSFEVAEYGSGSYRAVTGAANGTWTSVTSLNNSGALLDGVYAVDKTYTVRGTITDKLQPVPFEAMLRTEDVVQSWSKHGSAFKKVWERGALDVGGDVYIDGKIYVDGQLFNPHRLTTPTGRTLNITAHPDTVKATGFYYLLNGPGRPNNRNGYLLVQAYTDDGYVSQDYIDVHNGQRFSRLCSSGTWSAWTAPGLNQFYPVGAIFSSTVNTSPQAGLGGTWQSIGQTTQNGNTIYSWKRTS